MTYPADVLRIVINKMVRDSVVMFLHVLRVMKEVTKHEGKTICETNV